MGQRREGCMALYQEVLMSKDDDKNKKLTLTVVVSGTPTDVEAHEKEELSKVADKALKQVGSKEKDLTKWKLTDSKKNELSFSQTVESAGLKNKDTLFLDLRAGVTG
jgi:hypothetical protein